MSRLAIVVMVGALVVVGCSDAATPGSTATTTVTTTTPPPTTTTTPPLVVVAVKVLDTEGRAIENSDITVEGVRVDGEALVSPGDFPVEVEASAPGYRPASTLLTGPPTGPVALQLDPVVLRGTVASGSGTVLPDAIVRLGSTTVVSGSDGSFELSPAVPGIVSVRRPAWMPTDIEWDGSTVTLDVQLAQRVVRATHAVSRLPSGDLWESFLDIADQTDINAVVFDVKDESGVIRFQSEVPLAIEVGAVEPAYRLDEVVAEMHERGLYVIGRVVSFEDPVVASVRPDLAIRVGSRAFRRGGQAFLDPTSPNARGYNIDLAVEACMAGVDEIQFDYVRFPTGLTGRMTMDGDGVYVGSAGQADRLAVIGSFLEEARSALHPLGCAISADVFAIVLSTQNDQGIGQRPEEIGAQVDVLSPMIYPDHYSDGWIGFASPADHPYAVVENALADGMPRLPSTAIMRPWIADFNYGASSVEAEIGAAESFDLGWMLWNPGSRVTESALEPAP
jgi:hypothetical protein